jgi:hypothetical protein
MRRHAADTAMTATLRDLDPAPTTDLTEAERERADTTFARIVATPSDEPVAVERGRTHRGRGRLMVAVGLAGAAGVAIPGLLLGGGSAYGSWTPTPEPLTDVAAANAAATCRAVLDIPDRGERVAVAERRGEWTYVLLAGPGTEATCLMPDDLVGQEDPVGKRDEGYFASYDPHEAAPPTLDPDQIDETSSMEGSTDEGWFTWSEGYVGSDVTGVTVHTSSGLDIEASVAGNRFAAWWPSIKQSSDHPAETWSYTVHLADGSTRRTG